MPLLTLAALLSVRSLRSCASARSVSGVNIRVSLYPASRRRSSIRLYVVDVSQRCSGSRPRPTVEGNGGSKQPQSLLVDGLEAGASSSVDEPSVDCEFASDSVNVSGGDGSCEAIREGVGVIVVLLLLLRLFGLFVSVL
ncbi:hypothetical protein FIBSPDRAFT_866621, partial [Athelia psychrophila]